MKKRIFIAPTLFFLFFTQVQSPLFSQAGREVKRVEPELKRTVTVNDTIKTMPSFPSGERGLQNYISSRIRYPSQALEAGVGGKVIVRFLISKEGKLSDFQILKGIGLGCDEEAVRILRLMPKWIPGTLGGKPVPVWFTLPVIFTIGQ